MQKMDNIIQVKNLTKKYKKADKKAVDDISFYVEKGTFFSFLGPNGAGKTTTVSILTTTLSKNSGEIEIAGFDIDKNPEKVRENIGVIFQNPSLDENLTAEENVRFHVNLYGLFTYRPFFSLMPDDYKNRVYELAEVLDLRDDIFKPVKSLSGGMKRKLEIIRGLMHHPKVLFLDEPTTGLDPISRKNLWDYLKNIQETEKITIFLTTHYLEEAEDSDYICIINSGKIAQKGTPEQIKNAIVEHYLIIDSNNRNNLKKELKQKNIKYTEEKHIKIKLDSDSAQKIIKKIDIPLTELKVHKPTLEEAYIEIIKKDEK